VAQKDLRPSRNHHRKAEKGCEMKKVEVAGQVVNSQGGEIEPEHGSAIESSNAPMLPPTFVVQENECSKNKADYAEADVSNREYGHSDCRLRSVKQEVKDVENSSINRSPLSQIFLRGACGTYFLK
jgi:hypothetical protein